MYAFMIIHACKRDCLCTAQSEYSQKMTCEAYINAHLFLEHQLLQLVISMKLTDFSETKAAQAVVLREQGLSQSAIAARFGVNQSTIHRCLMRHQKTGSFKNARCRGGRNRVTAPRTDNLIRRMAVADPTISSSCISARLPEGVKASARTIRRRLHDDFHLKAYRPAAKPRLSAKNVKDRMAFCRRYQDWTVNDWKRVMYSDEASIRQYANYATHVRRPSGERFVSRYTVPKVKQSPTVMVWGCIAASGRGGLWIMPVNTTIKATTYAEILAEKLPVWMPRRNCDILQQDNAPVHTAKCVQTWIRREGFQLLEGWPGSSPDLNPIENCWVVLKKKIAKLNPSSYHDLVEKIKLTWATEISKDYCKTLVESMPSRIQAVLKAKGGHTKY